MRSLAALLGLSLGLLITWIAGESPWHILSILGKSAFGSRYDFGMTLVYATPLVFTGLAVAMPLQAGLFNIGAEGQLTMGALAAAATGILLPGVPGSFAPALAMAAAFGAGALWGAIPGWLKATRGSHEVINTIMLNFVASGLSSWVTLYLLRNPATQNPETREVGAGYLLSRWSFFGDAPVSGAVVVALVALAFFWVFTTRSVLGFQLKAVGENPMSARLAGIRSGGLYVLALALGGGLAGLVGVPEILGNAGKFKLGFSPDYGFMGIAVALLGRGRPGGILAAALLFGALHKGALDLDFDTENVTRDLSQILQALIILSISANRLWDWKFRSAASRSEGYAPARESERL